MTEHDIIQEFYDILETIRYPEVVQIKLEEFKTSILSGSKRIDLLKWLLQESPNFNNSCANKLNDTPLEDTLFKWYSQIGLCNSLNVLLGDCTIEKQLPFLSSLILFIKNVHLAKNEPPKVDNETMDNTSQNNLNSNNTEYEEVNLQSKITYRESNDKTDESSVTSIFTNHEFDQVFESNLTIKENIEDSNQKIIDYESAFKNFNLSFKKVTSLPLQDIQPNSFAKTYSELPNDIEQIYNKFSIFNQTLINENKIKDYSFPENSEKIIKPLSIPIKENLVAIEQACNMIEKDEE